VDHWGLGDVVYIKLYSVEVRMEPYGTTACISRGVDISPSTVTLNILLERNELIGFIMLAEKRISESVYNRSMCQVVSEASIFKTTAAVDILLPKWRVTWSASH
jgi:hypothetical protein